MEPMAALPIPAAPEEDFGPNNEKLPPDLRSTLHSLVTELFEEASSSRRDEIKRIKQAREYWRGNQLAYWSDKEEQWKIPTHQQRIDADQPYTHVTNIYQAYGLTIIAALSQSVPKVKFWPQSPQQEDDIATADAATVVAEFVQRSNRMEQLLIDEAFALWTDGTVGGYVRWVADEERFGAKMVPRMVEEEVPITEPFYKCPQCEAENPEMGNCQMCQLPLGEDSFVPPETAVVPRQDGEEKHINGQVVIDIIGKLELKIPPYARELRDFPYIAWPTEIHRSKILAMYPNVREKVGGAQALTGTSDTQERQARIALSLAKRSSASGAEMSEGLVTFHRVWLRPSTFYLVKDIEKRDQLLQLYPSGCYVAFADDEYCESRDESMDDCWRIMHALPGDGQSREPIGGVMISVQDRYNTIKNIETETFERGIPITFADRDVLNLKAFEESGARPGTTFGVKGRAGQTVEAAFHETKPAMVSSQAIEEEQNLMGPVSQFLTGAFPALFGGGALNTETAAGYAMQRDQAMGRLGMVFRRMREFHAELMTLAVECFRKNRTDPLEVALLGPEGKFDSKLVRLEDLRGNFHAYPEADESFPESFSQKKQALVQLLESGSPLVEAAIQSPTALRNVWKLLGIRDVKLPGEEARQKQYREIQELLLGAPVLAPPTIDPMTGAMVPSPPQPTVPIDPDFDDHQAHWDSGREWVEGAPGQDAKANNPGGYENVRAHLLQHKAILDQIAMQEQMAIDAQQAAKQPPPPKG